MKNKLTTYTLLLTTLAFSVILFNSCGKKYTMAEADELYEAKQFYLAAEIYSNISSNSKKFTKEERDDAALKAGEAYRMANDFKKAQRAYEKVLRKDPRNTAALFQLGNLNMLQACGGTNPAEDLERYRSAREYFTKYLAEAPGDKDAMLKLASCDSAESWMGQKSRFVVSNFKEANTKYHDWAPMIGDKKDNLLFFATDREGGFSKKKLYAGTGNFFSDIYSMEKTKAKRGVDKWGKPELIKGEVNNRYNEGAQDFDRRYSTMYFTRCNGTDKTPEPFCKIYEAQKVGNQWVQVTMLSFCADSANFGHPTLNDDGSKMYFASDMEGGYGGYDLYVVNFVKRGKTWSDPINLGPIINTEKNEMFPYWNTHEQALYFSSNGHLGMGGLDIFKSEGIGEEWTEPENLKYPLNSGGDDFAITFENNNRNQGYFTSNRCDGRGGDDIYRFEITPLVFKLAGTVTNCKDGKPLGNSTVRIFNDKDTNVIILTTDFTGNYDTVLLDEKTTYRIDVENPEGYFFPTDTMRVVSTVGYKMSRDFIENFCLSAQIDFERVVPIFYDLDKAIIRPDAAKRLDEEVLPLLEKYPKLRFELGSHTDCRSSYAYNIGLSQRRADSAVSYLVRKGIDKRRLVAKGYGESMLLNDCACEGTNITARTPYVVGKDKNTGNPIFAQKQVVVGDTILYQDYRRDEIMTVDGIQYIKCDEFQHRINRRTTIKVLDVNFDSTVTMLDSDDPHNVQRIVIIKLEKTPDGFKANVKGNGVTALAPSLFVKGDKLEISTVEIKNLVKNNALSPEALIGVTPSQITAGRIPAGAKVVLKTLTFTSDEQTKTFNNVELLINGSLKTPYSIGLDALVPFGAKFNEEEGELALTPVNLEALKDGPVGSKILEEDKVPEINPETWEGVIRIKITTDDKHKYIAVMVNERETVTFAFDLDGRNTWVTEELAEELYKKGVIGKKDFYTGNKIKLQSGFKLPGDRFSIETIEISSTIITSTDFKISNKAEVPTLGRSFFRQFTQIAEKDGYLYLVPKPARRTK